MDYPWAVPGAKVVCVKEGVNWRRILAPKMVAWPRVNGVYTIRGVFLYKGVVGMRMAEIVNPPVQFNHGCVEPAFGLGCFRPLITKTQEQDIEMFRKIAQGDSTPAQSFPDWQACGLNSSRPPAQLPRNLQWLRGLFMRRIIQASTPDMEIENG